MNNIPRLGYFDIDPEKFAAMIEAFKREECIVHDDDSMDGDFDSAMASAGFGTDEDYGIFDDYNDFFGEE